MSKPLAVDLYCGLGGWTEGLLAEGYRVVGFDIERHEYGDHRYPAHLVLQDILTVHGRQFKDAALIVASPPCQFFSYVAMPWSRGKALAEEVRNDPARLEKELALFRACFRIQREACEAAGRHIPMVVENVRGAEPWVGRAAAKYGSFYLWADAPVLIPSTRHTKMPKEINESIRQGKSPARWTNPQEHYFGGIKQDGDWSNSDQPSISRMCSSKSSARKAASAVIAKIPYELARWVAWYYHPGRLISPARYATI